MFLKQTSQQFWHIMTRWPISLLRPISLFPPISLFRPISSSPWQISLLQPISFICLINRWPISIIVPFRPISYLVAYIMLPGTLLIVCLSFFSGLFQADILPQAYILHSGIYLQFRPISSIKAYILNQGLYHNHWEHSLYSVNSFQEYFKPISCIQAYILHSGLYLTTRPLYYIEAYILHPGLYLAFLNQGIYLKARSTTNY